jgi:hypothetical protein
MVCSLALGALRKQCLESARSIAADSQSRTIRPDDEASERVYGHPSRQRAPLEANMDSPGPPRIRRVRYGVFLQFRDVRNQRSFDSPYFLRMFRAMPIVTANLQVQPEIGPIP